MAFFYIYIYPSLELCSLFRMSQQRASASMCQNSPPSNLGRCRRHCRLKYNVRRSISTAEDFIPSHDNDLLWWSMCSFAYLFVPHASLPPVKRPEVMWPAQDPWKEKEGNKTFKGRSGFPGGKSKGVLRNESLTGRTNVSHFLDWPHHSNYTFSQSAWQN